MALDITVGDVIAHLSQFPTNTKILASVGAPGRIVQEGHLCFQANSPGGVLNNLMVVIWEPEDSDGAEFATAAGEVKPVPRLEIEPWDRTGKEFVEVRVKNEPCLPPDSNPFRFDLSSMGTDLVRGWMVMHEGFDRKEQPRALNSLTLVNTRSGQRILLTLQPIERPRNIPTVCANCHSYDNSVSQDGTVCECNSCGSSFPAF